MLMHTREGTIIVTQQEKLEKKPDNRWTIHFKGSALFHPFCCRENFISYLQRAVFTGQAKLGQAHFYSIHFLKVRHFPLEKSTTNRFLEFFLKLLFLFKTALRPIFIWRGTSRFFVSRLAASRPKKLFPLVNELVKLDSAVVSMGFSGALSSFSHFSWL